MNHSFSIGLACEYGIEEAILIHHFSYWIEKNRLNGNNFHDGKYWSYDSVSAMTQQFPYMNQKKLYRVINRLCDIGILEKGNYNKKQYDRTSWYTLTELGFSICQKWQIHLPKMGNAFDKNGKCISQKEEMDLPKMGNGFTQNGKPIPDTTTYTTTNTDIREDNASFDASHSHYNSEIEFVEVEEIQSVETTSVAVIEKTEKVARAKKFDFKGALLSVGICEEYANAWMEVRKSKKATNSEQAFKILCKEFSKAFYASGMSTNECAEWAIKRDWKGFDYKWVENDLNKNSNGFKTKRQQHEEGLLRLAEDVRISAERARNLTREEELKRLEDVPF